MANYTCMLRPNLILLTVECWRGDHLGTMTPNLLRLGEEGAIFSSAYASGGWTLPSMTALMSSTYASMFSGPGLMMPERQVLAECLLHSGYWTAGYSANPVCGTGEGFHRGFGQFRFEDREPPQKRLLLPGGGRDWLRMGELGIHPRNTDRYCDAAFMTDRALGWIDRRGDKPFFLWLHYMDPHWPCIPSQIPNDGDQIREACYDRMVFDHEVIPRKGQYYPGDAARSRWILSYRDALKGVDREIGRLLHALRQKPEWDRTIVGVMGDHGEDFYEHGTWHHAWNKLYGEGLHVPLILRVPGAAPTVVTQLVSGLDIAPTLLDYAGADQRPGARPMMGISLRPAVEGKALPNRAVCSEMVGYPTAMTSYLLAIFDGEWKYIYDVENPHSSKLFHTVTDPAERQDLSQSRPDVLRRFEGMRLEHVSLGLARILRRRDAGETTMDPLVKDQMIALGYLSAI